MKLLVSAVILVLAAAEPPRFNARFTFQRQESTPSTTEDTAESTTSSAPYPPSGWKPDGPPFNLPQEVAPTDVYGPPSDSYGPPNGPYPPSGWKPAGQPFILPTQQQLPATDYGVPDNATTTEGDNVTTTDNPKAERLEGPVEVLKSVGTYYIVLPSGELQKVELMTENDVQNMAYTARLQIRDRAPLLLWRP